MTEELTEAEATALEMLAKSRVPYVRRSLVDLIAGPATLDALVGRKLVEVWSAMAVEEREYHGGRGIWREKRARRVAFAALTPLGTARTARDVFYRGDAGEPFLDRRMVDEDGNWLLPDTPIRSRGGATPRRLCPDIIKDQPEVRGRRRPRKAG